MEEIIKVAFRNLSHQKTRTILTLLGVIVGIAAVVALISLGAGLSNSISGQLEQFGADKIIISPKMSAGFGAPTTSQRITDKDLDTVKKVRGVSEAVPLLLKNLPAKFKGQSTMFNIFGIPPGQGEEFFNELQRFDIHEGRLMESTDNNVVVIGYNVHSSMFATEVRIRDKLEILGTDVRVIGILDKTGDMQYDNALLMPINAIREISNDPEATTFIYAKASEDPKTVAQRIEQHLEDLHHEKLFQAFTTEQLIDRINSVFGILSLVLIGIAGISLVVASFGIMNTMLMAVIERTHEIGIMKAIGATNKRILSMFIIESAFVGFIGGLVGIALGYVFSFGFSGVATSMFQLELLITLDPVLIIGMLSFSTLIGIVSGTYPAYRAAKLNPVEALRYE
jgi:putative ABC transport system permease protein